MKGYLTNKLYLLFILLLPFSWVSLRIGSIYRLATIAIVIVFFMRSHLRLRIPQYKNKLLASWFIYVLYSCLTIVWGGFTSQQLNIAMGMLILLLMSIVFIGSNIEEENYKLLDYMWIIAAVFFVILFLTGSTITLNYSSRQSLVILGTKTDANEFASYFAIAISVIIIRLLSDDSKIIKTLLFMLLLASSYIVLMSGSRGALIACIIAALVTLTINNKITLRTFAASIILLILFGMIFSRYIIELIPTNTIQRLTVEALLQDNGSGRSSIWKGALYDYLHGDIFRMIFGYGVGGLESYSKLGGYSSTMHNQLLQVLVDYGLIGLILFIRLIYQTFREYFRVRKSYIGAFIGILVMALTISMGPSYKIIWVMIMITFIKNDSDGSFINE